MWLITTIGFFSAVKKPGDDDLTVRARAAGDLDALRERYLPGLTPTQEGGGTDYPYRARVSHAEFADALAAMARDIDYDNFKNAVAARQTSERASIYGRVWSSLQRLEGKE